VRVFNQIYQRNYRKIQKWKIVRQNSVDKIGVCYQIEKKWKIPKYPENYTGQTK
jgi:hypothetical protein